MRKLIKTRELLNGKLHLTENVQQSLDSMNDRDSNFCTYTFISAINVHIKNIFSITIYIVIKYMK